MDFAPNERKDILSRKSEKTIFENELVVSEKISFSSFE